MQIMTTRRTRKTTRPTARQTTKARPTPVRHEPPNLRPFNEIATDLKAAVAHLPRCEYLQAYLAPLLNLGDCEG
jgi:hypothetical protein